MHLALFLAVCLVVAVAVSGSPARASEVRVQDALHDIDKQANRYWMNSIGTCSFFFQKIVKSRTLNANCRDFYNALS